MIWGKLEEADYINWVDQRRYSTAEVCCSGVAALFAESSVHIVLIDDPQTQMTKIVTLTQENDAWIYLGATKINCCKSKRFFVSRTEINKRNG